MENTKTQCVYAGCDSSPCFGWCKGRPRNMTSNLTPLHLEIVLHYHSRADDMENLLAPGVQEYLKELVQSGMVEQDTTENERTWRTTERGSAWINALLSVPFPEQRWEVTWPQTT